MKYTHILFDLDGTLTDSGEGIMKSGSYALTELGIPVPESPVLRTMVGPPLSDSFARFGVAQDKIEEAIRLYRHAYHEGGGKYLNSVYPGIEEMLKNLRSLGLKLYVATSKPETLARDILSHFGLDGYFEFIAGATLDHSRENKADVLRYLLGIIGSTEGCLMVGDTHYDVIGAHEMALPCLAVSWGYGSTENLENAKADAIVNMPEEICEYVK